jgi:hypothetical protein
MTGWISARPSCTSSCRVRISPQHLPGGEVIAAPARQAATKELEHGHCIHVLVEKYACNMVS